MSNPGHARTGTRYQLTESGYHKPTSVTFLLGMAVFTVVLLAAGLGGAFATLPRDADVRTAQLTSQPGAPAGQPAADAGNTLTDTEAEPVTAPTPGQPTTAERAPAQPGVTAGAPETGAAQTADPDEPAPRRTTSTRRATPATTVKPTKQPAPATPIRAAPVVPAPTVQPPPAPLGPQAPRITSTSTYREGVMVYLRLTYSDANGDASGFGFVGVNGSGWSAETHSFASPSYGRVGAGRIDYPFNLNCGTTRPYESYVAMWIYDRTGLRTQAVTVHLRCG